MPEAKKGGRRAVKFKKPGDFITAYGQRFDASNITIEAYDELVKLNPAIGDHFEVTDEDHHVSVPPGEEKEEEIQEPATAGTTTARSSRVPKAKTGQAPAGADSQAEPVQ